METNTIFTFLCIVRNLSQSFAAEKKDTIRELESKKKKKDTSRKKLFWMHIPQRVALQRISRDVNFNYFNDIFKLKKTPKMKK